MPTHTISSSFLKLCSINGLTTVTWFDLSGVSLSFERPAELNILPKEWSDADLANVASFYSRYKAISTEDERAVFASTNRGTVLPGRKIWQAWVGAVVKRCKIQERIAHIFSAENCHPTDVDDETRRNGAVACLSYCIDDITMLLIGPDALDRNGRTLHAYRPPLQAIGIRTWQTLVRRIDRAQTRFEVLEKQVALAFSALSETKLTKAKITSIIRTTSKWRDVASLINTVETTDKVNKMQVELDRLMLELGANPNPPNKGADVAESPRLFNLSKEVIDSLATEENVQAILNLYRESFDGPNAATSDIPVIQPYPTISAADGVDAGVDRERGMDPDTLASRLGFIQGLPFLFNDLRRTDGANPWSNPDAFEPTPENEPFLTKLSLHWHQLAGVHAFISACFSSDPLPGEQLGVLISDEVGLGKTYQAATIVAFLADSVLRRRTGRALPLILSERPYLGDSDDIPELPHLFIVPGTLLSQWQDEIRTLFAPGGVDILVYPTSLPERRLFWSEGGAFKAIAHPLSSVIILVTHSVLQKEYSELYLSKPSKGNVDMPWAPRSLNYLASNNDINHSLFGHKFLTGVVDEAHTYRNHGGKHASILCLLSLCKLRIPLTATPLLTSTKDLAAMGRLAGIAYFFTEDAWEEEKQDARELRQARRDLSEENDFDDDEQGPLKLRQVEIARRMQVKFEGRVIRRATNSLDWQGGVLVPLPPLREHYGHLDLTPREQNIITANGSALQDNVGTANMTSKLATRGFYIEYRTSVMFARENPEEDIPYFNSLAEWEPVKSTKLDTAARICQYLLQQDGLPIPTFSEGVVHYEDVPAVENPTHDLKIVVFTEFASMIALFTNVFLLYGIKVLAINGGMTFSKRASVIERFKTDPAYRVIALSSVGTTGINLAFCRVIIFLDQPWSAQDIRQMTGRVHRQPQKHPVDSIHLLANDTADVLVSGMANGKSDMMNAFLSKKAGQELYDLLSGGGGQMDSDYEDESASALISTGSSKHKKRITDKRADKEALALEKAAEKERKKAIAAEKREQKKIEAAEERERKKREAESKPKMRRKPKSKAKSGGGEGDGRLTEETRRGGGENAGDAPGNTMDGVSQAETLAGDKGDLMVVEEKVAEGPLSGTHGASSKNDEGRTPSNLQDDDILPDCQNSEGQSLTEVIDEDIEDTAGPDLDGMDVDKIDQFGEDGMDMDTELDARPKTPVQESTLGKRNNSALTPLSSRRQGSARFQAGRDGDDLPPPISFPSVKSLTTSLPPTKPRTFLLPSRPSQMRAAVSPLESQAVGASPAPRSGLSHMLSNTKRASVKGGNPQMQRANSVASSSQGTGGAIRAPAANADPDLGASTSKTPSAGHSLSADRVLNPAEHLARLQARQERPFTAEEKGKGVVRPTVSNSTVPPFRQIESRPRPLSPPPELPTARKGNPFKPKGKSAKK